MNRSWMEKAECVNHDPEMWFPITRLIGESQRAVSICSGCSVKAECYSYSREIGASSGIWGGMNLDRVYGNSELEEDLSDAVRAAADAGWTPEQIAKNLKVHLRTVKKYLKPVLEPEEPGDIPVESIQPVVEDTGPEKVKKPKGRINRILGFLR